VARASGNAAIGASAPDPVGRMADGPSRLRRVTTSLLTQMLGLLVVVALAQLGTALLGPALEPPLVVTAVGLLPLLLLWRRLSGRIRPLHQAASHWARGEWEWRTGLGGDDELGQLARTLDAMAAKLGSTVRSLESALAEAKQMRHLAEEREARLKALARTEQLRALGQMAGGVAHDLNQSLTLLAGYAELARDAATQEPPDLGALREMLPIIARAAQDGGETVRRLLVFGRGEVDSQPGWIELSTLLRGVAQLTAPRRRCLL
jgi:signal transduction histidine kinase